MLLISQHLDGTLQKMERSKNVTTHLLLVCANKILHRSRLVITQGVSGRHTAATQAPSCIHLAETRGYMKATSTVAKKCAPWIGIAFERSAAI